MSSYEDVLEELYDIPAVSFNTVATVEQEVIRPLAEMMSREEEDELIKNACETSALEWQRQIDEAEASWRSNRKRSHTWVRGGGSSCVGRTNHGGFGRFHNKVSSEVMHPVPVSVPVLPVSVRIRPPPPQGYVCKRCKMPGHFIQHCPTNGDPDFDIIKKFKSPTGIPKERLIVSTDGSYTLQGGVCAVFKPNEDAFDKQFEGIIPSSSTKQRVIPVELHCPLCKNVMKDGVLASKCCFNSFCDGCIRDHLISNSLSCVCGAKNVLADSLLPNITLRNTINRYLQSGYTSSSSGSAISPGQDNESSSKKRKQSSPSGSDYSSNNR